MQKNIKSLLGEIHEKDTRELVADHVRMIELNEAKKEITVLIDKRYAINTLRTTQYIHHFIGGLKKCF